MDKKTFKDLTPEEKDKILKKAQAAGTAAAITGATAAVAANMGKKLAETGYAPELMSKNRKVAATVGPAMMAAGLGTAAVAKWKRKKLKKNDNSKK